jgi:hypothetical protein
MLNNKKKTNATMTNLKGVAVSFRVTVSTASYYILSQIYELHPTIHLLEIDWKHIPG